MYIFMYIYICAIYINIVKTQCFVSFQYVLVLSCCKIFVSQNPRDSDSLIQPNPPSSPEAAR